MASDATRHFTMFYVGDAPARLLRLGNGGCRNWLHAAMCVAGVLARLLQLGDVEGDEGAAGAHVGRGVASNTTRRCVVFLGGGAHCI